MHVLNTYVVKVRGQIDVETFNVGSPLQAKLIAKEATVSYLTIYADQSGLIGMLRHLHQQGYELLSMHRKQKP